MSPDQSAPTPRLFMTSPDHIAVDADSGVPVFILTGHLQPEDAKRWGGLIVRAVNAHQRNADTIADLREALTRIQNITDGHPVDADRRDRINEIARKVLAGEPWR